MVENVTNSDTLGGKDNGRSSKEIQLDRVIKPAVKGSWGAAENRTAAGGSRRRGCHVRRGREQHRRYLRPYTVKGQFYSVEDVQDLKQSIELLGVLQPLLVTDEEEDGKRRIIAGHRRRLAVMQLVDEGKERFRRVPILIKPKKNAILDRLALIMANRFREKTDWERMTEALETEKLVLELKESMNIPGRTRDLLAEIIETSRRRLEDTRQSITISFQN